MWKKKQIESDFNACENTTLAERMRANGGDLYKVNTKTGETAKRRRDPAHATERRGGGGGD